MSKSTIPRRWGTVTEAAIEFRVGRDTIRRMITRGDLYGQRVGPRLIRVDLDSLRVRPYECTEGGAE